MKLLPRRGAGVGALAVLVAAALVAGLGAALVPALRPDVAAPRPEPSACADAAPELVQQLQDYVDAVARPATVAPAPAPVDIAAVTDGYAERLTDLRCDRLTQRSRLTAALSGLTGQNPVAAAVAATLRSRLGDDPLVEPVRRELEAEEDLSAVAATLPAGSTLVLPAGTRRLSAPLVLLQPLALVGAGRARTTIVSTAPDFAILHLGAGRLTLRGLALTHEGSSPASVVVVPGGGYELDDVRIGGAKGAAGSGGNGLLVGARAAGDALRGTVSRSDLSDNSGAGIAIAVADAPIITGSTFSRNGACGICFRGASRGRLSASRFEGNGTAIDVGDSAAPDLVGNTVSRSRSVGISLRGRAGGSVTGNIIRSNGLAGIVVKDAATTRIQDNTLTGHEKVAAAFTGTTRAVFVNNTITGRGVGVQIDASAAPTLAGTRFSGSRRAAGLVTAGSRPRISGSRCVDVAAGWVVATSAAPVFGADACARRSQRA